MKNQYFGDIRDLFKYDLAINILRNNGYLDTFTFIPMLTPNDNKGHGNKRDYEKVNAGYHNKDLISFLKGSRKNVMELGKYLKQKGIKHHIYESDKYFANSIRQSYFQNINGSLLRNSLIFIDPDNGFEPQNVKSAHVCYADIKAIFDRMNNDSILMIYQHFRRGEGHAFTLQEISSRLKKEISLNILYISDKHIILFFLAKTVKNRREIEHTLDAYAKEYPKLY